MHPSSTPPNTGPTIGPNASTVSACASARALPSAPNTSRTIARATTTVVQQPTAWNRRATISASIDGASAQATLAAA